MIRYQLERSAFEVINDGKDVRVWMRTEGENEIAEIIPWNKWQRLQRRLEEDQTTLEEENV